MFYKKNDDGYRESVRGVEQKTLVWGEKTLMAEFRLKAGNTLPRHSHPHEQSGYLVSGHIKLSVGEESYEVTAGDGWRIAGGVEHGAQIIEDSLAIEVFSPVREDLVPK